LLLATQATGPDTTEKNYRPTQVSLWLYLLWRKVHTLVQPAPLLDKAVDLINEEKPPGLPGGGRAAQPATQSSGLIYPVGGKGSSAWEK
jgi:hypothetical protein